MVSQQLLDFIRSQTLQKRSRNDIEADLLKSGWTKPDIDAAFTQEASGEVVVPAPAPSPEPAKSSNKKTWIIIGAVGCGCLLLLIPALGIFGTAILLAINPAAQVRKAEEAKLRTEMADLQKAIAMYHAEKGAYPPDLTPLVPAYIPSIPVDADKNEFMYTTSPDGSDYQLCARLNPEDIEPVCIDAQSTSIPQGNKLEFSNSPNKVPETTLSAPKPD